MRTAHLAVIGYVVAVVASISIPLALLLTTGLGMKLFAEPNHHDVLQAVHAIVSTEDSRSAR